MPASFADWRDTLMPSLPGAIEPAVREVFLRTARLFYRDTRAWLLPLGPFTVWKGSAPIQLNPVDQSADVVYLEAWSRSYEPVLDEADLYGSLLMPKRYGGPQLLNPHTALFRSIRDEAVPEYVSVLVSAQPKSEDNLPDFASTHHFEALASGALSALHMQPSKPYTNADMAAYHARAFMAGRQRAKAERERLYQGAQHWRYPTVAQR